MAEDDLELEDDLTPPDPEPETDLEDEGLDTDEQDSPDDEQDRPQDEPLAAKDDQGQDRQQAQPQGDRRPSRSESRIRSLTEQLREEQRARADMSRRLDEIARQQQPQQRGESPEQRAHRFSLMTPEERMNETLRESEARFQQTVNQMEFRNAEMADRTAFQAKVAVNPTYAKWGPKVEALLAERAAKGQPPVEREVALRWLLGDAMIKNSSSKESRQERRQATQRVNAQRVKAPNSGGDTPAQRRQNQSVERRLENQQI